MQPRLIEPEQRRQIVDDGEVDDVARAVLDRAGANPRRPRRRRALHIEEVAGNAVRIALHHHRAVADVRQQNVGDADVIAKKIALRQLELWKVDFAQIGERDAAAVDLDGRVVRVGRNVDRGAAALRTLGHRGVIPPPARVLR